MLRVKLTLVAKKDIPKTGYVKGSICELENDVTNTQNGLFFHELNSDWEIVEMSILEYAPIKKHF